MKTQNKKWTFIIPIIALFGFTSLTPDLKSFCNYFESEQLDSCESILNNYFKSKQQIPLPHNEYYKRFSELDTLIIELSKLPCVDTCFYSAGGAVMKTNPPMTDISIYKNNSSDSAKYLLRVLFDEPMKIVWLRKL